MHAVASVKEQDAAQMDDFSWSRIFFAWLAMPSKPSSQPIFLKV